VRQIGLRGDAVLDALQVGGAGCGVRGGIRGLREGGVCAREGASSIKKAVAVRGTFRKVTPRITALLRNMKMPAAIGNWRSTSAVLVYSHHS